VTIFQKGQLSETCLLPADVITLRSRLLSALPLR
jgi:hypothetical protein